MCSLDIRRGLGLATVTTFTTGTLVIPIGATAPADSNGSTVDPDTATTSTVHKCEQIDTNGVRGGTDSRGPQTKCEPVSDIGFTTTKLNVDLTTYDDWKTLAGLKGGVVRAGTFKGNAVQKITVGVDGLAPFIDVQTEVDTHLVSETHTPDKVIPAEDFVVTLPMASPQNAAKWNYNVRVCPKNTLSGIGKQVTGRPVPGPGRDITYTVTTPIPKVDYPGGTHIKRYEVVDRLDKRINKNVLTPVTRIVGQNEATLADGAGYTLITAGGKDHNWATIQLTEKGRRKTSETCYNGNGDAKIEVTLTARFGAAVNLEGDLSNTAGLIPNDNPSFIWGPNNPGATTDVPGTPIAPMPSKCGKVVPIKIDTDSLANKAKCSGVQSQICGHTKTVSDATLYDSDPSTQTVDPLTIGKEGTLVTTGQGTVGINYPRTNDYINGAKKDQLIDEDYCYLAKTRVPEGCSLQADPLSFRVLAEEAKKKVMTGVTVTGVPKNAGFRLPLTDVNDVVFLTVAGVLLVASDVVVAYINKHHHVVKY